MASTVTVLAGPEPERQERSPPAAADTTLVLSPELVLVDPALREFALALLPERDPDAFLVSPRSETPINHPELDRFVFLADYGDAGPVRRRRRLVGRAAAYTLVALVRTLVLMAAGVAAVALVLVGVIGLIAWLA